jgi:hypothetical protein
MSLQLLRESFQITPDNIKPLPLNESTKIIESNGQSYKCRGAYLVETSRYDFLNENNRVYPKFLWERVIREQKGTWEGGNGLADHPKEEGSTKNVFCVWHNLHINEENKTVKGEMYLIGEDGQRAKEILEAGGKIELSSSGYGEISESDNQTVIAESYIIERVADWVLNASQKVYATASNKMNRESISTDNNNINNSEKKITIKEDNSLNSNNKNTEKVIENNKEITNIMDEKIAKVNEKALRINIKNMIKEIDKKSNLNEQLKEYREILTYCSEDFLQDFKEDVNKKISNILKKVNELAQKGLKTPALEKAVTDTTKKLSESETQLKSLKEKHEILVKKFEIAKKLITESKIGITNLNKIAQIEKANSNSKVKAEDYALIAKENNALKEENKKLKVENKYLTVKVESFKTIKEDDADGEKAGDKKDDKEPDDDADDKKDERTIASIKNKKMIEEEDAEDKADDKEDDKADKADDKKDESIQMNFREDAKIKEYFADLIRNDERYMPYKKDIESCKTLQEATLKALKLKSKIENFEEKIEDKNTDDKLDESGNKKPEGYKFPKRLDEVDCSRIKRNGWW